MNPHAPHTNSAVVEVHSRTPTLTLPPQCEEAYVHLNVLMLEHLQRRDMDAAAVDAHGILSLYVGHEVEPLPAPGVADDLDAERAFSDLKARLALTQQLPHDVPAREVLIMSLQRTAARMGRPSQGTEVADRASSGSDVSDDSSDEDEESDEDAESEEDDDEPKVASSSSSAAATAPRRQPPQEPQQDVDVGAVLARAVARLHLHTSPASVHRTCESTADNARDKRPDTHAPEMVPGEPPCSEETPRDAELEAQEARWMAEVEADIAKEMERLALVRKHR